MPARPERLLPAPAVNRRRELGSASARSTLLTVLGEYVHPAGDAVWTTTLLEALLTLGVEEKATRQAVTRTAAEGLLTSTRYGRRVRWELTARGRTLLADGTRRIYAFGRGQQPWDGRWLVLTVPIPETQRQLRHRLRTRLTWLGLGSPTSGLWISTDTTKLAEVRAVIDDLGLAGQAFAWTGAAGGIGAQPRLLAGAWDLAAVVDRYRDFIADFETMQARTDSAAFLSQVQMIEAWRRFPFLDPDLPAELLDAEWPGRRAAAVFHDRHDRWAPRAEAAWAGFVTAGRPGARS